METNIAEVSFFDCLMSFINLIQVIGKEGAELGLSGTFLEALFEEAVNDKDVIDSRKWVDKNYPTDDLNKLSGPQKSLT